MSADMVLGLVLPKSSTKSPRRIPATNASIARSSDISSAEFLIMFHRCIYFLIDSSCFCRHALSSSNDAGFLQVDRKFLTKISSKLSQLSMEPGESFFIQDLVAPLK